MKYNQLIAKYEKALEVLSEARNKILAFEDGYSYAVILHSYGSRTVSLYTNPFGVQEMLDEFWGGDNGIAEAYTTNPNHTLTGDELVRIITIEEFKKRFNHEKNSN